MPLVFYTCHLCHYCVPMQTKQKITNTPLHRRLSTYVVPHRKIFALAIFSMAIMAFTLSAFPVLIPPLLDHVLIGKDSSLIQQFSGVLFTLFIAYSAANFTRTYAIQSTSNKVCLDLRSAMFNKLLSLPMCRDAKMTQKDLAQLFITDLSSGSQAIISAITILVKDSVMVVLLLAWMFLVSGEFTLFILLILSVMLLVSQLINGYLDKINQQSSDASDKLSQALTQSITNFQTIHVHGGQSQENDRIRNQVAQMDQINLRHTNTKTVSIILGQITAVIILSALSYFLFQQTHNDKITTGEIVSLLTAATMLFLSSNKILSVTTLLRRGQQSLRNIFSFLDGESSVDTGNTSIEHPSGELIFDKVSYAHDTTTQPILNNLSFTIKPKQSITLVCASEDEKAALIDLILGITQPTSGKILVNGHPLANLKLTSHHDNIALISHKTLLFDDTIANNIAYGTMNCANEAKITAAAFVSHASEFIREMPQGLQTKVGDNEKKLSEIQCQHIAIARALLKNPSILIIDETFTSPASQHDTKRLQSALKTLMQGRTTLFITTQQPTLVKSDHVIKIGEDKQHTTNQLTRLTHLLLHGTKLRAKQKNTPRT